jgi:phosphoserine phosphatase
MPVKAIISDYEGTIFEHPTGEALNKAIAYAALRHDLFTLHWGSVGKLLKAKKEIKQRLQDYKEGKRHLWEVYEPFNEKVLNGRPVPFVNKVVDKFAKENAGKVDERLLRPIKSAHRQGAKTGILSVGYDYGIKRVLGEAGYCDIFDTVFANYLREVDGTAIGFTLEIYGKKADILKDKFLKAGGFREEETLYFGDSADDEPVAEVLPPGHFIVPFFATEDFRIKMAKKHKAFVPTDEADLGKYLESK